jgi:thiol-disulfide isomerase/thioredoxin
MNRIENDPKTNTQVMIGPCNLYGMKHSIFATWYNSQYKNYVPNRKAVKEFRKKLDKTQITVVFGSWCADSRKQVGRFYKILHEAGYKMKNTRIFAVNHYHKAPGKEFADLHIKGIPDFILFYHGKEIGRIVGSQKTDIEKDLKNILQKVD